MLIVNFYSFKMGLQDIWAANSFLQLLDSVHWLFCVDWWVSIFIILNDHLMSVNNWLGWATDLKTVPVELINSRVLRTGDGSHNHSKKSGDEITENDDYRDTTHFWGFGDKEMTAEDMKKIAIIRKLNCWEGPRIIFMLITVSKFLSRLLGVVWETRNFTVKTNKTTKKLSISFKLFIHLKRERVFLLPSSSATLYMARRCLRFTAEKNPFRSVSPKDSKKYFHFMEKNQIFPYRQYDSKIKRRKRVFRLQKKNCFITLSLISIVAKFSRKPMSIGRSTRESYQWRVLSNREKIASDSSKTRKWRN